MAEKLALYTALHRGIKEFIPDWYHSVMAQSDSEFDLWVSVDGMAINEVNDTIENDLTARWILAKDGDSIVKVRQRAIEAMINEYTAIIFVDGDDMLYPSRVESARKALKGADVSGCAMRLMDETGEDLKIVFAPNNSDDIKDLLLKNNIFGLTNTVYRTDILRKCLPIPEKCSLVDWFLITRAVLSGARLSFDFSARMAYRQYQSSTARVIPPFTNKYTMLASQLVLDHYDCVISNSVLIKSEYLLKLEAAREHVEKFLNVMTQSSSRLDKYVKELNKLPATYIWWALVAHPRLESIWKN